MSEQIPEPPTSGNNQNSGSMLRTLMYFFLTLFLIFAAIVAFLAASGLYAARQATAPVTDLMRQLVIPATPVILPNPGTVLNSINDEARLLTVSAEFEKIVTAERNQEVLWGALGESMIFVANGKVTAGIDLTEMTEEDIQVVDPVTVMIHMPEAKIFDDLPILDNDLSYVADRDTGLLARSDPELETEVRRVAEDEILAAAQESDIVERAQTNAQQEMLNLLQGLGFENVIFMDETPPEAPPYEPETPKGYVVTPEATPSPTPAQD